LHNEAQIVDGEGAVVALDQPVDDDRRHVMINSPPRAPGCTNRSGRGATANRRLHALRRWMGARLCDTWTWWRICISLDRLRRGSRRGLPRRGSRPGLPRRGRRLGRPRNPRWCHSRLRGNRRQRA
jgi:hypothetical protein